MAKFLFIVGGFYLVPKINLDVPGFAQIVTYHTHYLNCNYLVLVSLLELIWDISIFDFSSSCEHDLMKKRIQKAIKNFSFSPNVICDGQNRFFFLLP